MLPLKSDHVFPFPGYELELAESKYNLSPLVGIGWVISIDVGEAGLDVSPNLAALAL